MTEKNIQNKANKCLGLYLPMKSIRLNENTSTWANACDNALRLYPRRARLKMMQLDILPRE
jgi:hypothetical protein